MAHHLGLSGVMMPPVAEVTTDGYDLQFGTNVLGNICPALVVQGPRSSRPIRALLFH